ncbi:MAG: BofC C-terminal domain-containing protein [Oscillospiraceae bacterium]
MKRSLKILLLGYLIVTAAVMGTAAVKSISADAGNNTPVQKAEYASAQEEYFLRDWEGYVAVFRGGEDTPAELTDIETATLNNVDREKLRTGIPAAGKAELLSLLEDFSS